MTREITALPPPCPVIYPILPVTSKINNGRNNIIRVSSKDIPIKGQKNMADALKNLATENLFWSVLKKSKRPPEKNVINKNPVKKTSKRSDGIIDRKPPILWTRSIIKSKLKLSAISSGAILGPKPFCTMVLRDKVKKDVTINSERAIISDPFQARNDRLRPVINEYMIFIS